MIPVVCWDIQTCTFGLDPDEQGTDLFFHTQDLDSLRHQLEQLVEENVELELELQRSLEPPPGSPGEGELGLG